MRRPFNMVIFKLAGDYMAGRVINITTFKLDIPHLIQKHNILLVALFNWYSPSIICHL